MADVIDSDNHWSSKQAIGLVLGGKQDGGGTEPEPAPSQNTRRINQSRSCWPALPNGTLCPGNLIFRNKTRKSWGPGPVWWGGWAASWTWQCRMLLDRIFCYRRWQLQYRIHLEIWSWVVNLDICTLTFIPISGFMPSNVGSLTSIIWTFIKSTSRSVIHLGKNCPETAKVLSDPESFLYFSSLGIYNWYFVWSSVRWKGHHRWYLFSELTRLVRTIQYLVVEHGEVQSQTQPDGVGGLHFWFTDLKSVLVSLLRVVNNS